MLSLPWIPLGLIGIMSWSVWFVRRTLSRHTYSETVNDFRTTTSLVVPVYREDADVLERCLRSWIAEEPTEIILVVDDRDDLLLARLRRLDLPASRCCPGGTPASGARSAPGYGRRPVKSSCSPTRTRPGVPACWPRCRCPSPTLGWAVSVVVSTSTCRAAMCAVGSPTGC